MRKVLILSALAIGFILTATVSNAQSNYKTAVGLGIDFGNGSTLVGPSLKHFFTANDVGQFDVLFGNNYTVIEGFYQYHKPIQNAAGLKWFAGAGIGVGLYDGGSNFLIRPIAGLDYKINDVPLSFSFDWRPTISIGNGDSDFEAGRFGLGFRYAF
ncbi:MAG: hypothetical protein EOO01_11015 [Chitinophagaceae bacterium]|nr:MAG: hypothetical protein EOO01_11015 [Chitinophagaceae bacterium]